MAAQRTSGAQPSSNSSDSRPSSVRPTQTPITPISPLPPSFRPAQQGEYMPTPSTSTVKTEDEAAPPSYEDTMAEDMAPVDGRRRDYTVVETLSRSSLEKQRSPDDQSLDEERPSPP